MATHDSSIPEHIGKNIETIAALFAKLERNVGRHQRVIERLTDSFARPRATYVLALVIATWIAANSVAPHFGMSSPDPPPFAGLQAFAAIAALLATVIVLTTQHRLGRLAQQRAHLDLQVNLIAEEKIAKLIALVEELRRDLPSVNNRKDALAEAMTEAVDVHAVAAELESVSPQASGNNDLTGR